MCWSSASQRYWYGVEPVTLGSPRSWPGSVGALVGGDETADKSSVRPPSSIYRAIHDRAGWSNANPLYAEQHSLDVVE